MYTVLEKIEDGNNNWLFLDVNIDLTNPNDPFISSIVKKIKFINGSDDLLEMLKEDQAFLEGFDTKEVHHHILNSSIPDENIKPKGKQWLSVPRNELGEIIAVHALENNTDFQFPFATHALKENVDLPIRGLDGLGIIDIENDKKLVVVEVKTSEDKKSPPQVSKDLLADCQNVFNEKGKRKLTTKLATLYHYYKNDPQMRGLIAQWLGQITLDPTLAVKRICPVIIRGSVKAKKTDLKKFTEVVQDYCSDGSVGVSCSTGEVDMKKLCEVAFQKAKHLS